jgi:hypothetical protein
MAKLSQSVPEDNGSKKGLIVVVKAIGEASGEVRRMWPRCHSLCKRMMGV